MDEKISDPPTSAMLASPLCAPLPSAAAAAAKKARFVFSVLSVTCGFFPVTVECRMVAS
jgi:hypothetical protein